jgi:hypothetical protein
VDVVVLDPVDVPCVFLLPGGVGMKGFELTSCSFFSFADAIVIFVTTSVPSSNPDFTSVLSPSPDQSSTRTGWIPLSSFTHTMVGILNPSGNLNPSGI